VANTTFDRLILLEPDKHEKKMTRDITLCGSFAEASHFIAAMLYPRRINVFVEGAEESSSAAHVSGGDVRICQPKARGGHMVVYSGRAETTERLAQAMISSLHTPLLNSTLYTMEPCAPAILPLVSQLFGRTLGASVNYRSLPAEELFHVFQLPREKSRDLFVGGSVEPSMQAVMLTRGDLSGLVVPFSFFRPSGTGVTPDFTSFKVTDYGQTVQLGSYEAAADAILYELDPKYRQRLKKKQSKADRSFGACLRRLRLQRGISRDDFRPTTEKTIARLERGEFEPSRATLKTITNRLGVTVDEILSY